ncbi:MAG: hypothetical protein IJT35_08445 [Paludibacteraceae bacterium]|nr:hypothetical protein [Paludibacteraceae bacterium]
MGTTGILLVILAVAVVIFGLWFIQWSQFRNEEKKRQWELKRESQKTISPIRLRAYERLALLLERTKPEHMIMELRKNDPQALSTWSIGQVQQYLLQTIRAEFDHNQSQQVYVSEEVWDLLINARDQMASFIISIAGQLPKNANAQVYATTLLSAYASNGLTPTDKAMDALKNEAKSLM